MQQDIEYITIWKKVHGELSEQEEEVFQNWLNQNIENRKFYQKVLSFYKEKKPVPFEVEARSFADIKAKFERVDPDKTYRKYYVAAASLLIMLSSIFVWQLFSNDEARKLDVAEISTGKGNIVLIKSDGDRVELIENESITIRDDQARIVSDGKELKYNSVKTEESESSINTLVIPRGKSYNLQLADGTKVWLNSESVLTYPTAFLSDVREVEITGEAYFEVAKDASKPFILKSQSQTVTVLGTAFNITSYPDEQEVVTTLVEGSVKIDQRSGHQEVLVPGDQSVLDKDTGTISKSKVNVKEVISWKDGVFSFEEMELELILLKLSRWYDIKVFYENSSVKKKKFTGEIKRYGEVARFVDMLETTGTVNFKISGNAVIVK